MGFITALKNFTPPLNSGCGAGYYMYTAREVDKSGGL